MANDRAAQLVDAGVWLRLSGDLEGARKLFERALKLDPGNGRAREFLGLPPVGAPTSSQPAGHEASGAGGESSPSSIVRGYANRLERLFDSLGDEQPAAGPEEVAPHGDRPPPAQAAAAERGAVTETIGGAPRRDVAPMPSPAEHGGDQLRARPAVPGGRAPGTIVISGDAGPKESPPSSTPPMFEDPPAPLADQAAAGAYVGWTEPVTEPGPEPEPEPEPIEDAPPAWAWKPSSPQPQASPQFAEAARTSLGARSAPAVDLFAAAPRPSPGIDPKAASAWDRKSNPGMRLPEPVAEPANFDMLSTMPRMSSGSSGTRRRDDEVKTLLKGARDLLDLDDHTGAMDLIMKAQAFDRNNPEVEALRLRSEKTLTAMFESKLGRLTVTPRVLLKDDEIIWLNLDHRAGFVLAQIDGSVTFEDLFAVSGMSHLDTAQILAQLVDEGVISRG